MRFICHICSCMRLKNLSFVIFVFLPVVLFSQTQDPGIRVIDSLENEVHKIPDLKNSKGVLLGDLAAVYRERGGYSKAIEYYQQALKVFEALGNKNAVARVSGDIGSTYLGMIADTSAGSGKIPQETAAVYLHKAVTYLSKSISIANENGYADVSATFYKDLSVAVSMLNSVGPMPDDNGDNKPATEEPGVKMRNSGMRGYGDGGSSLGNQLLLGGKERLYFIGGIVLLIVVLLALVIAMYWTYKKQKAINSIVSNEKKKAEELLLNILPAKAATELQDKGMVHPQQFDNVTVIITDFVGFTTAAERFSPKQLVGELHACFKAFDGLLEKYKIEKIKTIGDAYLAIAGLPVADPNHAENALQLAINMRDFMLYRKSQLGEATFEMRIGVHTGSVVAGIVGIKKFAYDIWGDTVNLAARMEQNSAAGKINISQSTYEIVKDKFHCEYRGEIEAKNKGKLKMYYVLDKL